MPFDVGNFVEVETPNKEELRILDEMARTPWCQGRFANGVKRCIIGALVEADGLSLTDVDGKPLVDVVWSDAAKRVKTALEQTAGVNPDRLALFNDGVADFSDVAKVYARARKSFE